MTRDDKIKALAKSWADNASLNTLYDFYYTQQLLWLCDQSDEQIDLNFTDFGLDEFQEERS